MLTVPVPARSRARRATVVAVILAFTAGLAAAASPATLVVCAPGYPGSTVEAQPAMDGLAAAVVAAAGWQPGELAAVYFNGEQEGLERLQAPDAAMALVPLPFWLEHRAALRLEPQLQAVVEGGEADEPWSLVAGAGAVKAPADLADFELVSLAGYSPRFVRGPALATWGMLPATLRISHSGAVLSGLRRAANGDRVALLLDRPQATAMATLPFAAKLAVVASSAPLPVSVLCAVGNRLPAARLQALVKGFRTVGTAPTGSEALAGVRMREFVTVDRAALARAEAAFAAVAE